MRGGRGQGRGGRGRGRSGRGRGRGGRGRGRDRGGQRTGRRHQSTVLPPGTFQCVMCLLRSGIQNIVEEQHDRHFPWCDKHVKDTAIAGTCERAAAKEVIQFQTVRIIKKRLEMYGATTSGKKDILVERLVSCMDTVPPEMGVGSWFHFNKKETAEKMKEYCDKNCVLFPTGYVCCLL